MKTAAHLRAAEWHGVLRDCCEGYQVFAPILQGACLDYELITPELIPQIVYNTPKPTTPLKLFFLPVKENVVKARRENPKRLILGVPACDLAALSLLDEMYLQEPFVDERYQELRDNTLLIGADCFSAQAHCHCTRYGVNPFPEDHHDLSIAVIEDDVRLEAQSAKGVTFLEEFHLALSPVGDSTWDEHRHQQKRQLVLDQIAETHGDLPDYEETQNLVDMAPDEIWRKYASACVSCGACATICPTCTCFLLVDRPGFEKVRQMDACQYPGFSRVAAGEDPLHERAVRFSNRYKCKYVWKPRKFQSTACTGCGRCIETCIARINKNELFRELAELTTNP